MSRRQALLPLGLAVLGALPSCKPQKQPPPEALASAEPPAPPLASAPSSEPASVAPYDPSCPPRTILGTVSFAPDGQSLLTACSGGGRVCGSDAPDWDPFVDVWDLRRGRLEKHLDAGMSNISLRWGPGGLLATVADPTTGPGEVRVFDGATFGLRLQHSHYCIQGVDFDARGAWIAVAGADGRITAVDTTSGRTRQRPYNEAHLGGDYAVSVTFAPDARTLFVVDESAGLQTLSATTLRRIAATGEDTHLGWVSVAPGGALFAATDEAGALVVGKTTDPRRRLTLAKDPDRKSTALAWLDATRFVRATDTGELTLWDATGKAPGRALRAPAATTITSVLPDPAGARIVTVGSDGAVVLRDLGAPSPDRTLLGATADEAERLTLLEWSPSGDRIAALVGHRFVVWDVAGGAVVVVLEIPSPSSWKNERSVAWRADGRFLAVSDETVRLLRMADRAIVNLSVVVRDQQRIGLVGADSGAYEGPPDLARCAPQSGRAPARREVRPSLLADFMAGLPIDGAP